MRAGMWLDKDCGVVGVMRPGDVAAAVMKGVPTGGSVAVVQPSGRPRIAMLHQEPSDQEGMEGGRTRGLVLLDAKGKPCLNVVELSGGPVIRLNHGEGQALLMAAEDTVGLMVDGPEEKDQCHAGGGTAVGADVCERGDAGRGHAEGSGGTDGWRDRR